MLLSTTGTIASHRVSSTFGLVRGNALRARRGGADLTAFFPGLVGGHVPGYAILLSRARSDATNRMAAEAEKPCAGAVIEIRYTTAPVAAGMAEILVHGTAARPSAEQAAHCPIRAEPSPDRGRQWAHADRCGNAFPRGV